VSARDRSVVSAVEKRRRRQARVYIWRSRCSQLRTSGRARTLEAVGCGGGGPSVRGWDGPDADGTRGVDYVKR
jgi:hypothetical protein